jgi:hypothetical protein
MRAPVTTLHLTPALISTIMLALPTFTPPVIPAKAEIHDRGASSSGTTRDTTDHV